MENPGSGSATANIGEKVMREELKSYRENNARTPSIRCNKKLFISRDDVRYNNKFDRNIYSTLYDPSRIRGSRAVYFAAPADYGADKFLVARGKRLVIVKWNGGKWKSNPIQKILRDPHGFEIPEYQIREDIISYGSIDPQGRLWFGTKNVHGETFGDVWTYNRDTQPYLKQPLNNERLRPHQHDQNNYSNGIVWFSTIRKPTIAYYNDILTNKIHSYSYNLETGDLMELLDTVYDLNGLHEHNINGPLCRFGRMAIDTRGFLWAPLLSGSHVLEINPYAKKVERFMPITAHSLTACTFGGANGNILYVTSRKSSTRPTVDQGGTIFAVTNLGNGVVGYRTPTFLS
ncbi:regucalcin-like [Belonocnema kinseyi]|uniref:regucalcin-like n=1 Tax=Belonocnema kinseyi TaxID=2817044 RepID=UPI00143DFCE3|nr:regucalcin-like [Belonocnema kinseyi]